MSGKWDDGGSFFSFVGIQADLITSLYFIFSLSELLQREQQEMSVQLSSLQTEVRVSYGNDALMPDMPESTAPQETLPPVEGGLLDGLGFIHPESFNQANTLNEGTYTQTHTNITYSHVHTRVKDVAGVHMYTNTQNVHIAQLMLTTPLVIGPVPNSC